jgi:NAD(P)-dependent dehydrogenase (short-subunit alcohol dehydrogenase family)
MMRPNNRGTDMAQKWTAANLPRLDDKLALVTGANRGLGLEISAGLAAAGATVVLACRDEAKAQAALAEVRRRVPQARLETATLELADLGSVRRCAQDIAARFHSLDILCNNASAILVPQGKTPDGVETHLGVNHLGHFALTGLLLERLNAAPAGRIVNTSSSAHRMTKGLDLDDLDYQRRPYKDMDAYGRSKLAALLYTGELSRRLRQAGSKVVAAAAHPGWSYTNPDTGSWLIRKMTALMAQPAAMGALPALYAAGMADVQGDDFLGPDGMQELRGHPRRVGRSEPAQDTALAGRLWQWSEQASGVKYL